MFLFRVDGNSNIGLGHIMRCLAFADIAKKNNIDSYFFIYASSCLSSDIIIRKGYRFNVLLSDDLNIFFDYISFLKPTMVIVDSYYVDQKYMNKLHEVCLNNRAKLMYIDDLCKTPYSCDYLLNYNVYANKKEYDKLYKGFKKPILLLGLSYILLREEFTNNVKRDVQANAKNIFVSTGGSDVEHITLCLVEEASLYTDYIFHFVIGKMNLDYNSIKEKVIPYNNVILHYNVDNIASIMVKCDVAISAAGSTLYELCATQTPTISFTVADNQYQNAYYFDDNRIINYMGDLRIVGKQILSKLLVKQAVHLLNDYKTRLKITKTMIDLFDSFRIGIVSFIKKKQCIDKLRNFYVRYRHYLNCVTYIKDYLSNGIYFVYGNYIGTKVRLRPFVIIFSKKKQDKISNNLTFIITPFTFKIVCLCKLYCFTFYQHNNNALTILKKVKKYANFLCYAHADVYSIDYQRKLLITSYIDFSGNFFTDLEVVSIAKKILVYNCRFLRTNHPFILINENYDDSTIDKKYVSYLQHGDLHSCNFVVKNDEIIIFDFDEIGFYPALHDFFTFLFESFRAVLCFFKEDFNNLLLQLFSNTRESTSSIEQIKDKYLNIYIKNNMHLLNEDLISCVPSGYKLLNETIFNYKNNK